MKKLFTLLAAVLLTATTYAQIGINNENPDASAALDITSTTGGLLVPRMTNVQRLAITNPATSLLIFQIDENPGFYFYDGSQWIGFGNTNGNGDGTSNNGSGSRTKTLIYTVDGF